MSLTVPAQDETDKNGDNSVLTDECKGIVGIVHQTSNQSNCFDLANTLLTQQDIFGCFSRDVRSSLCGQQHVCLFRRL